MNTLEKNLMEAASASVMDWSYFEDLYTRSSEQLKEAQIHLEKSKAILSQREEELVQAAFRLRREEKKFQTEFAKHLKEAGLGL